MNEVASPACLRVPAHDVQAYAEAMRRLLASNDDEMQMRGLHARAHARRFDWDSAADAQEQFYFAAMEAQARRRRDKEGRHVAG
jgi:D-inositol-3-phosphate glycosyltransferase